MTSIDSYKDVKVRFELYSAIQEGLDAVEAGRTIPADKFLSELDEHYLELKFK